MEEQDFSFSLLYLQAKMTAMDMDKIKAPLISYVSDNKADKIVKSSNNNKHRKRLPEYLSSNFEVSSWSNQEFFVTKLISPKELSQNFFFVLIYLWQYFCDKNFCVIFFPVKKNCYNLDWP